MKQPLKFFSSVYLCTRSKKPKLFDKLIEKRKTSLFISGTKVKNYILKDPIVDWLNLYQPKVMTDRCFSDPLQNSPNFFINFIMNRGNEFEAKLIKYINDTKIPVRYVSNVHNDFTVNKTIELIKQGVPLIHSAPLKNKRNNTGGIADILIRSDYLHKLVNICPLTEEELNISAPKLNAPYHYLVIDIKFTTIPLTVNGKNILNCNNIPAYKSQVWIYTQALGQIQGYIPRYAFLLGRRWTKPSRKEKCFECDDRLGVVDFKECDSKFIQMTKKAVEWLRTVEKRGHSWTLFPPSKPELYPNMSIISDRWQKEKEEIAKKIGEISLLWYCGVKHREIAFKQGIKSWKDPECNSNSLGITGTRKYIIDKMIQINNQNIVNIIPAKITDKDTHLDWRNNSHCEVFLDFETITDIFASFDELPRQENTSMIFMIGVGYTVNNIWNYTSFIADKLDQSSEHKIMKDFIEFLNKIKCKKVYYWSAENNIWNQAVNRQNNDLPYNLFNILRLNSNNVVDLCNFFKEIPILIKGCFGFGLKSVSKAMKEYKMIDIEIPQTCSSGMDASVKAWNAYNNNVNNINIKNNILKDIELYNHFDCKVLYEILTYLRKNH